MAALGLLSPPSNNLEWLQVDPERRWWQIDSDDGGSALSNSGGAFFFFFLFLEISPSVQTKPIKDTYLSSVPTENMDFSLINFHRPKADGN
jgi:hypothetical protein